ncbi:MAG: ABC transporter ATP-binding protein [Deltaproteobacteria bacterium]|nr:ABC transporter ATP-binding protein [Deltaproteobacteria bacterium]
MIQYQGVSKVFGSGPSSIVAVDNVTFNIEDGNLVTFLGPSGCGKTTLLRLTNRLIALSSGQILIDGKDVMSWDEVKLRQSIGYAIQEIGLFPNKTIYGNIAIVPRLLGWNEKRISDRVDELLNMLRLDPGVFRDRYPVELSGGQQQRIGVARCLAADPDLLLMDEPFGAIDPVNREEIQDEFIKVQAKLKKSIAFVTHDIYEAVKMGDRIAIFDEGRLVQFDTPEVILMKPANKYIEDFVGTDRTLKGLSLLSVRETMNQDHANVVEGRIKSAEAMNVLKEKGLSHLNVIEEGKPIGYVTTATLESDNIEVKKLIEPYPLCIAETDNLRDALSNMLMHDIQKIPVINENGYLTGTISYDDIHRRIVNLYSDHRITK